MDIYFCIRVPRTVILIGFYQLLAPFQWVNLFDKLFEKNVLVCPQRVDLISL